MVLLPVLGWSQSLKTPAETSNYERYSQYQEVVRFLAAMEEASPLVHVQPIGKTLEAKDFPAANLYLAVISAEGAQNPAALKRNKPTMLIIASQHGNEQSGKESVLKLMRDATLGELKPILKQINLLIIPQANPYGNFVNRRQNEQNLDLNRDHVKLESPETQAIHKVIQQWMPEASLDVHEKGDDYYRVSTGCVSNLNIAESLQRFSRDVIFPDLERRVTAAGYTWHEYLITEAAGSLRAAGIPDKPGAREQREIIMRYSTTDLNDGRNAPGIYETLSFIQEGASRHDIETLKARTEWQYAGIRALVEQVAAEGPRVLKMVRDFRKTLLKKAGKLSEADMVHLRMEYVRDPKEPELVLMQFERAQAAGKTALSEPKAAKQVIKNWFPKVESRLAVPRALGYVVPVTFQDAVKNLRDHGIRVDTFTRDHLVEAESYLIKEIVPSREDYVAPDKIETARQKSKVTVRKGDFYVSGAQPAANLIPCLLEPQSEYGLIRYKAYKLIPEKGSVFPIIRVAKAAKLPLAALR
jgi:hypothetical protein